MCFCGLIRYDRLLKRISGILACFVAYGKLYKTNNSANQLICRLFLEIGPYDTVPG